MGNLIAPSSSNVTQKLIELKKMMEHTALKIGRLLYLISERKLYLDEGYNTFESFIAQPELGFKRSTAYDLKRVYKQWILEYGYSEDEICDVSKDKLLEAGRVATNEDKDDWLEKARTLSKVDLIATVREKQEEDVHDSFVPYPSFRRCAVCGKWYSTDSDWLCGSLGVH